MNIEDSIEGLNNTAGDHTDHDIEESHDNDSDISEGRMINRVRHYY